MKLFKIILSVSIFYAIVACSSGVPEISPVVFHYNQHNNITSLDPAYARSQNNIWAVNHIFSTLVRLDENLNVVAGIAKSWVISEDALTYTFNLRSGVLFHNDPCFSHPEERIVNADDVVYSFSRLLDTIINAPGSWIFAGRVDDHQPFTAVNDTVFQLKLKKAFAPLPSLLTMQYCSIVPEEAIQFYGQDFFKNPVGSGPFTFKRWIDQQGLFLTRYDEYFDQNKEDTSNLEGVRTSFIGERSIAFLELVNKRIDFFTGLESSYINTALTSDGELREQYKNRIRFIKAPYLNFEYLGINPAAPNAHPLLKSKEFRQALNYGIQRNLMLSSLRNNIGVPADAGVITKGLPAYDPKKVHGYNYNKELAINLLSQFDQDLLLRPLVIHTSKDYLDLTTFIAKQWENLGLTIRIEVMESATLRNAMRSGDVGMFRASWIADYPDGESFLSMFYSKNPAPPNYTGYSNREFDRLYDEALITTEEEKKIELYQSMDQLIVDDAPVIFLFYDEISLFTNKSVNGLSRNALNLLQVDKINKTL